MVDATKILQAIQNAGTEIAEQGIKSTEQVISTVVTGQELVGDAKPMSDEEMAHAKAEDERKKQEELAKLRQIPGRNVESEVTQVVEEKQSEEEQKQKEFLEKIKMQREAEERERENMVEEPGNAKREQAKRSMAPGKKKSSSTAAPNASQMSATSEFKGGKID